MIKDSYYRQGGKATRVNNECSLQGSFPKLTTEWQ